MYFFIALFVAVPMMAAGWTATGEIPQEPLQTSAAAPARARTPLAFEVATIKPAQPGQQGGQIRALPGGLTYIATNQPLRMMIKAMYRITDSQIAGGPDWMNTEMYDVQAKAEHPPAATSCMKCFKPC
jgi:hypothetical protein